MGGHAGIGAIAFLAGGSWENDGQGGHTLVSEDCVITRAQQGTYDVKLQQPTHKTDFMGTVTILGPPVDLYYSIEHVSDDVKRIRFSPGEGPTFVDASFSFLFTKGGGRNRAE